MALPEAAPIAPPDQQVQEIPTVPEVPAAVEQATGVQAVPSTPQPLQDSSGATVAQPVPAPPSGPSITIPAANAQVLTQMAKGNAANSQTWFGVFWLKKIKKAIKDGLAVLFGS